MKRLIGIGFGCSLAWTGMAFAQGRGGSDWMTSGNDAQRTSWVRTDAKISKDSLQKPGFQFLWKVKLNNAPKQLNSLTPPALLERYIGYRGFWSLAFLGGSSDKVFALDVDLGRMEWEKNLASGEQRGSQQQSSPACPGGMTANVTRPTTAALPGAGFGRGFGGGRGGPAKSGVGEPYQGAVTLAEAGAPRRGGPPFPGAPVAPGAPGAPPPPAFGGFGGFARTPIVAHALSNDGMLHTMYVSNGEEPERPVRFLPPNANARGLIVLDNVAYAATTQACGGVANGVWALDLASKPVTTWKATGGGVSGSSGPAFAPDGTLYVATPDKQLVALEPKTLKLKASYTADQEFTSTPVVFEFKGKTLVAAAAKDGILLFDSARLAGGPISKTPANSNAGALASWEDSAGARWLLSGSAGNIVAWKVLEHNGAPSLQPGWVSRDMVSPLPPMILNGVVFAVAGGRQQPATRAVLYALDATTGKELWSSGNTITSFVHGEALSGGGSQVYVGTHDGTLYAFGFPIEH